MQFSIVFNIFHTNSKCNEIKEQQKTTNMVHHLCSLNKNDLKMACLIWKKIQSFLSLEYEHIIAKKHFDTKIINIAQEH